MSIAYYDKAEIYLTACTHPDHLNLRYLGLDTKCDPNYLGSSVTLKWFINKLGRRYFTKQILETTSGTMREVCAVEQRYILDYNAVKDSNFLNMNGGIKKTPLHEELLLSLEYNILPIVPHSQEFVDGIVRKLRHSISFFSHSKQQLVRRILCMVLFGYLRYEQEVFEYCRFTYYGSCDNEDLQGILTALANLDIIDSGFSTITITENFIDELPVGLDHKAFAVDTKY